MKLRPHLLTWQWELYAEGHRSRRNLAIHLFTQPIFVLGASSMIFALPLGRPTMALGGLIAAAAAIVAQGRGHAEETTPPVPFLGPFDVISRIIIEQFITWPRFLLTGGFSRAWAGTR